MFIDKPKDPNGLCVVVDVRFKYDKNLQEEAGGQPVLREWGFAKEALGRREWARTTRVALYDYAEDLEALTADQSYKLSAHTGNTRRFVSKCIAENKTAKRAALLQHLAENKYSCIVIVQSRSAESLKEDDIGEAKGLKGTMAWQALHAPDSLPELTGCVWESPWGRIVPLLNPVNYREHVHGELIRRNLRGAWALAIGAAQVLKPESSKLSSVGDLALLTELLTRARSGAEVAVDIESYSTQDIITAVGLSDGDISISVPWEAFPVYGTDRTEPAGTWEQRSLTRQILASNCAKIFHNYTYDVPFLIRKSCPVNGPIHDTFAMHGVIYKQWRHGLQRACASELLIPPWKSLWHPKHPPAGLSKDDAEWWILDPVALRDYNAKDAFYTRHLYNALAWKLGIML